MLTIFSLLLLLENLLLYTRKWRNCIKVSILAFFIFFSDVSLAFVLREYQVRGGETFYEIIERRGYMSEETYAYFLNKNSLSEESAALLEPGDIVLVPLKCEENDQIFNAAWELILEENY